MSHTHCWNCSGSYPTTSARCPKCGATNANKDHHRAACESSSAGMTPLQVKGALLSSVMNYGRAVADELPESQQRWLDDIKERVAALEQHAYAEGRADQEEDGKAKAALYRRALLLACGGDGDQLAYFVSEAGSQS